MTPLMIAALGASAVGSAVQAGGARKAASAGRQAADADRQLQERMYNTTRGDLAPTVGRGNDAGNALNYLLGLAERPNVGGQPLDIRTIASGTDYPGTSNNTNRYLVGDELFMDRAAAEDFARQNGSQGTAYGGFQETPGFQFALDQGREQIEASAAARGGLYSGRAMQDLMQMGQGYANQELGNYLNRLQGVSGMGSNAAAGQATANQNFAMGAGNALYNRANATAAGAVGAGNAFNNGLNNAVGLWGFMDNLRPTPS